MVTTLGTRANHEIGVFSLEILLELGEVWRHTHTITSLVPFVAMIAILQRVCKMTIAQHIVVEQVVVESLLWGSVIATP